MSNKSFAVMVTIICISTLLVFTGFKIPYSESWAMGNSCMPDSWWSNLQRQYFPLEFLTRQVKSAEKNIELEKSFKIQLIADIAYKQETFGAKIRKTVMESKALGMSDFAIETTIKIEKESLESEVKSLSTILATIPKKVEYYESCAANMNAETGVIISNKCGEQFYNEARRQGATNQQIFDFLKEKSCL